MYRIVRKEALRPTVTLYEIEAPLIAKKAQPGQFIILRVDENGERIPITINNYDPEKGTVTIIVQTVGATTEKLSHLNEGDCLQDFVGPLGKATETEGKKKVCVVGQYLNMAYFGGNAVGQTLKINGNTFTIVGVMAQEGSELEEGGTDDCVFVPYSTAARLSYTGTISSYTITVQNTDQISEAKAVVEQKLYQVFSDDDAYTVTSMAELVEEMNSMVNMIIYILAGIAAISLVVGGIGIMNIMLVSVTERTREIGIRKALGAKESAIMRQFVIEAATTSSLGGVLGILLGYGLSALATSVIANVMPDTPITVSPSLLAVVVAFGVSTGIGVVFGYLPAKKAANLNPIDALRYD